MAGEPPRVAVVSAATNTAAIDRVLARRALEAYARRREADRDPQKLVQELPALVDRAIAAGLDAATVSRLALGDAP